MSVDRYIQQSQEFQRLIAAACGNNTTLRDDCSLAPPAGEPVFLSSGNGLCLPISVGMKGF